MTTTQALALHDVVGVVGAGTMGAGIAQVAARAGHEIRLLDLRAGAAEHAVAEIRGRLALLAEKGRLAPAEAAAAAARLTAVGSLAELAPAALIIEAVLEDLEVKRRLFRELEAALSAHAILATNTSSLSITAIGATLERPGRLVGMHFFNPAPVMELVEVVGGLASEPGALATIEATAAAWGKTPVRARNTPGFIVNRVARPFYGEGLRLLAEGAADPATLDAIYRECGGFKMGPFELTDLIGQDVNAAVTRSVWAAFDQDARYRPSRLQDELVEAGRLGRKTGCGFYDYRAPLPEPASLPPGPRPRGMVVEGDLGPASALIELARAAKIPVDPSPQGPGVIWCDGVVVRLADGLTATEHAAQLKAPVVVFDLAHDYLAAGRIALAAADQATPAHLAAAAGLFQAMGRKVSQVADLPGLVVMRTVVMLANEAAEAAHLGVATPEAIDLAMRKGAGYPSGPLEWAGKMGRRRVVRILDRLAAAYGPERYRPSVWLRRRVWRG